VSEQHEPVGVSSVQETHTTAIPLGLNEPGTA